MCFLFVGGGFHVDGARLSCLGSALLCVGVGKHGGACVPGYGRTIFVKFGAPVCVCVPKAKAFVRVKDARFFLAFICVYIYIHIYMCIYIYIHLIIYVCVVYGHPVMWIM